MRAKKYVRIKVPASTGNLGAGLDVLGLALTIYNHFEFEILPRDQTQIWIGGEHKNSIPRTRRNLVYRSFSRIYRKLGRTPPEVRIKMYLRVPLASGMGSSATAIIAGTTAANLLAGNSLNEEELLREIVRIEGHPDNVTASLYGGLTAVASLDQKLIYRRYLPHRKIKAVLVIPDYTLETEKARTVVPRRIKHQDALFNLARVPFVIDTLVKGELENLSEIMSDRLHEPYRKKLIKGYEQIKRAGLRAGAAAVVLSGAGPSMVAFCTEREMQIATAMSNALRRLDIGNSTIILSPCRRGMVIEEAY